MLNTKKIISLVTLGTILLGNFSFSLALKNSSPQPSPLQIEGVAIKKFQDILDKYFIKIDKKDSSYRYYYTNFGGYIPNAKYNKIVEKELELLILETYENNKDFYKKFESTNFYSENQEDNDLKKIIQNIPKANSLNNISDILFNENFVSDQLLESSFKINYNNNNNYNSFLNSLDRVIKRFKSRKGYYPSLEELKKQKIYLNREEKKVGDEMDDVIYKVIKNKLDEDAFRLYTLHVKYIEKNLEKEINNLTNDFIKKEILEDFRDIKENNLSEQEIKNIYKKYHSKRYSNNIFRKFSEYIEKKFFENQTYILKYKDKFYTLEEAKAEIKKIKKLDIQKKDYEKLIQGAELKNIPEIYKKIPKDSIFVHVKNPKFLFSFLDDKKNTSNSGLQIVKKLRDIIVEKMGVDSWEEIKNNLQNEFIIVLSDLDLVSPNFLIILDKKDKGILIPGKKAMAAKTIGDKIYISLSKELLEKYSQLDEKDSIYNSSDFRYVWFKKQNIKKDIFFFAGDKFFEKITSLEYFLKMKRKINDYVNLENIQNYVFALQKIKGEKLEDFEELKKLLKFKKNKLKDFEIKKSIVTNKNIGKIGDIKNLSEINYNLEKISRAELASYKENILDYREIWQESLDPLGVIFSEKENGFEIDFFMTPIPSLKNSELEFLSKIFSNFGKKDFEIIKNPKMRIGMFGGVFGFDSKKFKKYITSPQPSPTGEGVENRDMGNFLEGYNEINREFFGGDRMQIAKESILDFLDGEFLLAFGGIDTSIFDSWNAEKLDLILAIKFKNNIKAKEFISILRKKFVGDFSRYSRNSIESKAKGLLAKPLGEEYQNITIYSVPAPYIGNIYYSIIDSFAYISISKNSIKNTINFYKNPTGVKQKFIKNYLSGDKILYGFLDTENLEKNIDKILSKDNLTDLYVAIKREGLFRNFGDINPLNLAIKKYYNDYEYSILKGKKVKEIKGKIGILSFYSENGEIFLSIKKNNLKINNLEIKAEIDEIFEKIDKKFFTKKGGNILELLNNSKILEELFTINIFNSFLNKDFRAEIIPNNLSVSFGIGDNEIQLKMASFTSPQPSPTGEGVNQKVKKVFSDLGNGIEKTNNILYIIIGILSLVILGGIGFVFYRKK